MRRTVLVTVEFAMDEQNNGIGHMECLYGDRQETRSRMRRPRQICQGSAASDWWEVKGGSEAVVLWHTGYGVSAHTGALQVGQDPAGAGAWTRPSGS
jgi:hypothetical protein